MCRDVHEIDIISAKEMTQELFIEKYDLSGRPVLGWSQAKYVVYLLIHTYLIVWSPIFRNKRFVLNFMP